MHIKLIKLLLLGVCAFSTIVYLLNGTQASAFSNGPPGSRTNAPALGTFPAETACSACHSTFPLNSGPGRLTISGLPAAYVPNQEIAVTVIVSQPSRMRYGFQATALDDQGRKAGELIVTDASRTRVIDGTGNYAGRQYVEHSLAGVAPSGMDEGSWTFTWKAPAQSVGRVTFYVSGNAANGNAANSGDYIYTTSQSIQAMGSLTTVSSASFAGTGTLTAESIATIFGANLANGMASATTIPLPLTLAGAAIKVRDAAGTERDAPLFFASPMQINFLIPAGTSAGVATITVSRVGTEAGTGTITIGPVAPSLFSAAANGQGLAAAVVFRVRANGTQSYEPVVQFNQMTNRFDPVPIDLGPDTDQVFLIAYGTGLRGRTGNSNLANVGGTAASVSFAGAQGQFEGLDQANLLLPRTLIGRGNVDVTLTLDGRRSNAVSVNIK